jgi:site-specific DNA-methyltransferase (adenine-specific)
MIELHNVDCMSYMAGLPDKAFDLAIVDPPYGLKWNSTGGNSLSPEEAEKANQWDQKPTKKYWKELRRVSRNFIVWGGNHFLDDLGACSSFAIWDKGQRGMHFADGEMAWMSFKGGALRIFNYPIAKSESRNHRIHPTQKPIALYNWILQHYANPGDRILDTHLGSGSIAIACHRLGFDLVGCELDADYFKAAKHRLEVEQSQLRIGLCD